MTDTASTSSPSKAKEIRLRFEMVDGVLQIDVRSRGLNDDPNLIALHLQLALDRMLASAEVPAEG
jgi:hypothetical protein